ncbi:hypothetical protein BKA70DRAFT_1474486 [Coprinopsis sp. MPI-PUGE-AT-0042]|nr:hypothetical protein BKA70DRAFT_1474486 [Coprinopsis sp. MPI-PUGE-AT-0042]
MAAPVDTDTRTLATVKHLANPTQLRSRKQRKFSNRHSKVHTHIQRDPLTFIFTGKDSEIDLLLFEAGVGSAVVGGSLDVLVVPNSADDTNAEVPSEGRIIGVAVWFPPGTAEQPWWMDSFIPHMRDVSPSILPEDLATNAWHLHLFGVLPAYHGQGLGKALFRGTEEQARSTSSPIVVETSTEVDILIYRKLGLDVVGETNIESEYGTASMTFMVKKWD